MCLTYLGKKSTVAVAGTVILDLLQEQGDCEERLLVNIDLDKLKWGHRQLQQDQDIGLSY